MHGRTHTIRRTITAFGLAAAVAAFAVASASASGGNTPPLSYTGASASSSVDPAAFWRHFEHEDSLSTQTADTTTQCPCNTGLVGGPTVSIAAAGSSTSVVHQGGGFNWTVTGIGAGIGLALIALALGALISRAGNDPIKRRRQLAGWLERAAVPERAVVGRGPRYIVRPEVTEACALSLRAIAASLRNETLAFGSEQLRALEAFVSNGADSPLFGDDPTAALREAVRLQHSVVGAEPAVLDYEQMAVAV